jgi:phosphoglycolate phosphatase-like HAD superfamily hydrolase
VILIGDTPRDVAAGKEVEVRTLAVATGIFTREELSRAGADGVIESFSPATDAVRLIEQLLAP